MLILIIHNSISWIWMLLNLIWVFITFFFLALNEYRNVQLQCLTYFILLYFSLCTCLTTWMTIDSLGGVLKVPVSKFVFLKCFPKPVRPRKISFYCHIQWPCHGIMFKILLFLPEVILCFWKGIYFRGKKKKVTPWDRVCNRTWKIV